MNYLLYQKLMEAIGKISTKLFDCTHSVIGAMLQSKTINMSAIQQCDVLFVPFCSEALYSFIICPLKLFIQNQLGLTLLTKYQPF